jgi:hypothetical protein
MAPFATLRNLRSRRLLRRFKEQARGKTFFFNQYPLIKSFEPDEEWGWCYVDELLLESLPGSLITEWCGALGATP